VKFFSRFFFYCNKRNPTFAAVLLKNQSPEVLSKYQVPARVAELVDALVSKTNELCSCRFDSGLGYSKKPCNQLITGLFFWLPCRKKNRFPKKTNPDLKAQLFWLLFC
jgi:hypothetical protein